jgi:hypothetical protein
MEANRKWLFSALGILLGTVGLTGLLNFTVDPYGLLRKDFSYQFIEPNKNFIKIRFIAQNPDRYDAFVFGSSRANSIDVRKIQGYKGYNVHYNGGLPRDHLYNLRYLLKKGVKIRLILIGLDDFSSRDDPTPHLNQPLRYPYPPVLNLHPFPFYLRYFFSFHDWKIMQEIWSGYEKKLFKKAGENPVLYDLNDTGQSYFYQEDRQIEANPEKHRNDPKFLRRVIPSGNRLKEVMEDLREIVRLAEAHQVRLVLFIHPLHKNIFLDSGADFERFKRALSNLSGFYDFSGLNSITTDNFNYYETSHYRRHVGDLVIARIFDDRAIKVPEDFGQWVTAENIDLHLESLRRQLIRYPGEAAPVLPD